MLCLGWNGPTPPGSGLPCPLETRSSPWARSLHGWLCPRSHSLFISSHLHPSQSRHAVFLLVENSQNLLGFLCILRGPQHKTSGPYRDFSENHTFIPSYCWDGWLEVDWINVPNLSSKWLSSCNLDPVSRVSIWVFQIIKCWFLSTLQFSFDLSPFFHILLSSARRNISPTLCLEIDRAQMRSHW